MSDLYDDTVAVLEATRRRLQPYYLSELRLLPDADYLVKGVLDLNSFACIYGDAGCGKTFLAMHTALQIARGLKWFGRRVKRRAVLYVAAEPQAGIRRRFEAAGLYHSLTDIDRIPLAVIPELVDFRTQDVDVDIIISEIKTFAERSEFEMGLVVVDTVARSLAGGNDSNMEDMSPFIDRCDKITRATGATVLAIHHSGKDASRGTRGSTTLPAAVDTLIEVAKDAASGLRFATIKKQRDGTEGEVFTFKLLPVEIRIDEDGDPITSCVVELVEASSPSAKLLTKNEQTALDALVHLVDQAQILQPESSSNVLEDRNDVARSRTSPKCPVVRWREEFRRRQVDGLDTKPDTMLKRFKRAAECLKSRGKVGIYDGQAWVNWDNRT